jgi:hypothetical protein
MLQPVLGGYQKRDENQPGFQVDLLSWVSQGIIKGDALFEGR